MSPMLDKSPEASITYGAADGVAMLTLNHAPRLNAMTHRMWLTIPELVSRAEADSSVRVIALTGAGDRAFSAGADISQFGEQRGDAAIGSYHQAVADGMDAVLKAAKPTVALIRGICFGGGCALALTCDVRLARADARFRVPAARLGLGYTYRNVEIMAAKLGMAATADILLSARILDAEDALRRGVAQCVWPKADYEAAAAGYLSMIADNAPLTLAAIKRALVELAEPESRRDEQAADRLVAACFASEDYLEGQTAFMEKRKPRFRGT
jgi:enoyl-CoA hydratase/carnithine racemase